MPDDDLRRIVSGRGRARSPVLFAPVILQFAEKFRRSIFPGSLEAGILVISVARPASKTDVSIG